MAPTPTSVMSGQLYLKQHGQRVQSFGSPRLDRLLIDLREDPDARKALDRRVRRQQAEASPRRPPPPTAQQRLLAALHQQAAEDARRDADAEPPLEDAPAVRPLVSSTSSRPRSRPRSAAEVDEKLTSEDGRDMLGDAPPLVPVWGEDDEPPPATAAPKPPAPTPREPSVEELLQSNRPHQPQSTDTPWTVEVVSRARGHWNVEPMALADPRGATVRRRQKGLELHGPFHFSSDDAAERQRAITLTRDTGPREPPGYVPVPRLMPRMRVERPVQLLRL